ncbi:MAG: DnaJ domain-containing protein [Epsilonproteobacteria bacterium]|nr:DnaJ domain-containing protein [Campylobacterota bacterium]
MTYEDFQKALDTLGIVSRVSMQDIKNRYQKLSKVYHPDMQNGNDEKFRELNEAYKIIQKYIKSYRFKLDEDEFYEQNPFSKKSNDWFYDF